MPNFNRTLVVQKVVYLPNNPVGLPISIAPQWYRKAREMHRIAAEMLISIAPQWYRKVIRGEGMAKFVRDFNRTLVVQKAGNNGTLNNNYAADFNRTLVVQKACEAAGMEVIIVDFNRTLVVQKEGRDT